ncbi:FMN-dependent NADH-azoreductase [Methylocella tundrae]|uniref:FMN dependent NADH:quinone oxidoreductase n=1 Tax=Methylocella tundrae TaxID=227605 RepID=A0A4U8Z0I3_METTU|nr:NAD(P)H-dependent oxidoreductase [Methylocella tundrae]WPP05548.1 NAD(P)H-dependent oxidoreductase [Methylocella tundrae]VFU07988.1 FMN-dependent NADH-azoreductase 2 [Methylocella tundrae]
MHLLHVEGSPRKQRSASLEVARSFIGSWQARYPSGTIDTLDVWNMALPPFDGAALDAKYAGLAGQARTVEQETVWNEIRALAERFHRADLILFSAPMWNFGIPYRLKHLIDAVSQKDLLFTFDERGLLGLLGGRTVVIVAARGVALGEDFPEKDFDFQSAYLRMWSRMVGVTDVRTVTVEKTLFGTEADEASRSKAKAEAEELAGIV